MCVFFFLFLKKQVEIFSASLPGLSCTSDLLCQSPAAMTSQDEFKAMITLAFQMFTVFQLFRPLSESKNVS